MRDRKHLGAAEVEKLLAAVKGTPSTPTPGIGSLRHLPRPYAALRHSST